jgi:hypothetical protein
MIYTRLKKTVTYHLIAGIALSAVIITLILLSKYENSLLDAIGRFELIRVHAFQMKQAAADMDSLMKKVSAMLPPDYNSKNHRELLLLALDDIKTTFKGSEIIVTRLDEKTGELFLPVTIKFHFDNYSMLVSRIGYLQSMKFPQFTIKNILIERTEDKQIGAILLCKIEGLLKMPAESLKDGKK